MVLFQTIRRVQVFGVTQHSEGTGELDYTRINATSKQVDKDKYVGLSSSKWILQPGQSYENAKEQHLMPKQKLLLRMMKMVMEKQTGKMVLLHIELS